jgi:hypothetical protein
MQHVASGIGGDPEGTVEFSRLREMVHAVHEERMAEEGIALQMDQEQVGQFLEFVDRADERQHARGMAVVVGGFAFAAFFLVFIVTLAWLLLHYQKSDLLVPLITHIVTAVFAFCPASHGTGMSGRLG